MPVRSSQPSLRPTSLIRYLLPILALLCAFISGCSAVSGGTKSPANPPSGPSALSSGGRVGSVEISLNEEQLPPEVIQVATDYEVVRILGNRVRERLQPSDAGYVEVEVDVIGMRLRSNGTAIWWGFMAGGDWITVNVDVLSDGEVVKSFQTGTGTALGGFAFGGRSVRVGRMMKTLAERIAEGV